MATPNVARWWGDKYIGVTREKGVEAVARGASYILEQSDKTVPYREGVLASTGHVDVDPSSIAAFVSYDTPYAVKQHEDRTLRHSHGRTAKYLQNAMEWSAKTVLALMADVMRGAFRR
jgi:hypothetical protein